MNSSHAETVWSRIWGSDSCMNRHEVMWLTWCITTLPPLGVLPPAQQRGPAGLSEPHHRRRAHPDAAGGAARGARPGLPLRLLHPSGGADPVRGPAAHHPAHRRQPGLLAPQPQGGVLEPDEADRTQRGRLRGDADPSHRRLNARWLRDRLYAWDGTAGVDNTGWLSSGVLRLGDFSGSKHSQTAGFPRRRMSSLPVGIHEFTHSRGFLFHSWIISSESCLHLNWTSTETELFIPEHTALV